MSPTKQQIDEWNPGALTVLADAWCTLASSVEGLFGKYVESVVKVEGQYWEAPRQRPCRTALPTTTRPRSVSRIESKRWQALCVRASTRSTDRCGVPAIYCNQGWIRHSGTQRWLDVEQRSLL